MTMFITYNDRITNNQAMVSMSNSILGAGLLLMPRTLIDLVRTPDAWMTLIITGLITFGALALITNLSQHYKGQTMLQYIPSIVGKYIGALFCLFFCLYFIINSAYELRILGEVIEFYLLNGTPMWAVLIPFMLISYYLLSGGINAMVRLFQIVFPISFIIIVITYGLSFSMFDVDNLKPVLSEGFGPVFHGVKGGISGYAGYELAAVYIGYMNEPKKAIKAFGLGLLWVFIIYVVTILLVIGSISMEAGILGTWSTIDLIRNYELEGFFFERIEILFLIIWVLQIFCIFSSMYYGASHALAQVIGYNKRPIILGLLPVLYIIAMLPRTMHELFGLGNIINFFCVSMFAFLIVIYAIHMMRNRWFAKS